MPYLDFGDIPTAANEIAGRIEALNSGIERDQKDKRRAMGDVDRLIQRIETQRKLRNEWQAIADNL